MGDPPPVGQEVEGEPRLSPGLDGTVGTSDQNPLVGNAGNGLPAASQERGELLPLQSVCGRRAARRGVGREVVTAVAGSVGGRGQYP